MQQLSGQLLLYLHISVNNKTRIIIEEYHLCSSNMKKTCDFLKRNKNKNVRFVFLIEVNEGVGGITPIHRLFINLKSKKEGKKIG